MKNTITTLILASISTLTAFAGGYHQCSSGDRVENEIIPAMKQDGFSILGVKETSPLEEGETYTLTMDSRYDTLYFVSALGDQFTEDVDVKIYAPCGRLIAEDTLTDKNPEASFTGNGGTFSIVFEMVETAGSGRVKVAIGKKETFYDVCDNYVSQY